MKSCRRTKDGDSACGTSSAVDVQTGSEQPPSCVKPRYVTDLLLKSNSGGEVPQLQPCTAWHVVANNGNRSQHLASLGSTRGLLPSVTDSSRARLLRTLRSDRHARACSASRCAAYDREPSGSTDRSSNIYYRCDRTKARSCNCHSCSRKRRWAAERNIEPSCRQRLPE